MRSGAATAILPAEPVRKQTLPVYMRPATSADLTLIYSTWLRTYGQATHHLQMVRSLYFSEYHRVIEGLLSRSKVLCAVPEDDPVLVCGYLVYEAGPVPVVHWGYVKQTYRRMGLFNAMLERVVVENQPYFYTHRTHIMPRCVKDKGVYNQLLLYRGME